jgi:hypothetical protein
MLEIYKIYKWIIRFLCGHDEVETVAITQCSVSDTTHLSVFASHLPDSSSLLHSVDVLNCCECT